MSQNPTRSSTSLEVRIDPNIFTALRDEPGEPDILNEFQHLQSSMVQVTQENTGTDRAQNTRDLTLRHEVNMRPDPVDVFPFEIISIIFELSCEPREKNVKPQLKLMSVCKQWREVATNIPRLWAIFHVPSISPDQFCVEQFKLWLQRSEPLPVYLLFPRQRHFQEYMENQVYDMPHGSMSSITDLVVANKDRIYGLNPSALPEVVHIKLFAVGWHSVSLWPILSHITIHLSAINEALGVLQCCPRATFVKFTSVLMTTNSQHGFETNSIKQPFVDCPNLRLLEVRFGPNSEPGDLFNRLLTPALEDLTCYSFAIISPMPALQALLQRSLSSLHRLHLVHDVFDSSELTSLLAEQSALRKLSLNWRAPSVMNRNETRNAFGAVGRLLLTDAFGKQGSGKQFTTGKFLPRLETFEYKGLKPWSTDVTTAICQSHPSLENGGRASGDQVDASSVSYRPLQFLHLTLVRQYLAVNNIVYSFGVENPE